MWDGTFRDWDLAIEVATLPDHLWAGDDALAKVAREIARIEARVELLREIDGLRAELNSVRVQAALPSVGHNQGPSLQDDVAVGIDVVWPLLDQIEKEAKADAPDPNQLKLLAERLWEVAKVIALYCGQKLDVALDKAVETASEVGTKWTIRLAAAHYASTNETVQAVAKAAWKFAEAWLR